MDPLEGASTAERFLIMKAERHLIPITGSLELLPLCNLNCKMCYVRLSRPEMEAQGRMRTGEEWLALGRQMVRAGTLFLLLTGGEPLLHPDFKEIYLGLRKMGLILTINTNATLIDEDWADFFARNKPRRINITLYGASDVTYEGLCGCTDGCERVVRAVKLLRQRGVDVKISTTITPANVEDLSAMLALAKTLDVPLHAETYVMPAARERSQPFEQQNRLLPEEAAVARIRGLRGGMGEEMFHQYRADTLRRIDSYEPRQPEPCAVSCHGGKCSFTVNWQGMLRACVVTTLPEAPAFELGFQAAWQQVSREFNACRFCADCSVCRLRPICRVCAAAPQLETGDAMARPEYLCRYAAESERLLREAEVASCE
ncbi:MAG: radical SAM protein [Oscillospiraceae bacterium]|nr:radical SAM protein [Oscillospiraceae bacterium]